MSGSYETNVHSTDINAQIHHGKFRSVVTVSKNDKFADFNCADAVYGGDDAACIQAAIDYCAAHSIIELWIFDGTYTFPSKATFSTDIIVRGIGEVILVSSQTSGALPEIFDFNGSKITTITGSDVLAGDSSITVSDASSIQAGDLLLISDNTKWNITDYPNLNTGELHEVDSISDSVVSFIDGLLHPYTTANALSIDIIRPISVTVDNIKFRGTSRTVVGGLLQLKYCNNSQILNSAFSDDGYYGLSVYNCLDTLIFNNKISNFRGSGYGYGIVINDASAHTDIYKNNIRLCRHCVASGGFGLIGQARDICVKDNKLFGGKWVGSEHVVDAHSCVESISVCNNTIYCNNETATISGAKLTIFRDNKVHNGLGTAIRGNTQDIVYIVQNNYFYSCGYAFLDSLTENCSIALAVVENNHMRDSSFYIAYTRKSKQVKISNNSIDQTTNYYGIYVVNVIDGMISNNTVKKAYRTGIFLNTCQNLSILNNNIADCNTGGSTDASWGSGLTLLNCSNTKVTNNIISDVNAKMRYCIYEYGESSNNNVIKQNEVSGAVISQVYKIGNETIVKGNNGYRTENTGTATIPATTTSISVTHGLAATPTNVSVTPKGNIGWCWVDTYTATTFIIHCSTAPASNTDVNWTAIV